MLLIPLSPPAQTPFIVGTCCLANIEGPIVPHLCWKDGGRSIWSEESTTRREGEEGGGLPDSAKHPSRSLGSQEPGQMKPRTDVPGFGSHTKPALSPPLVNFPFCASEEHLRLCDTAAHCSWRILEEGRSGMG